MRRYIVALVALLFCSTALVQAQNAPFTVNGNVALASLITIADGHFQTMADTLEAVAATDAAKSGDWTRIRTLLQSAKATNVAATFLYARRDGTYWLLDGGLQKVNVSDRPYFKATMTGRPSIGTLLVTRSSGKKAAVVAVPVRNAAGNVIGLVAAALYLDELSKRIVGEMALGPNDLFWAIDTNGTIALHSDPSAIFVNPHTLTPQLQRVVEEQLAHDSGTQTYEFRGKIRTIVYRKSPLTGWRFGFGVIH